MSKITGKPDTSMFKNIKDPTEFLESGSADRMEKESFKTSGNDKSVSEVIKAEPVIQKIFRFRLDTINALKVGAAQESVNAGKRITETEIVEKLIRKYYKLSR